jgi:hypothetical protein
MGHFDMRWRALLPGGGSGQRTGRVPCCLGWQQLISLFLTNLSTTVRQDFRQDLCQIANQMEPVYHLLRLRCAQGGSFGKILATISAHDFDFWF